MNDEVIPAFQEYWRREKGQSIRVFTSFAGSGTVTHQITLGAPAQVAMVAKGLDVLNIEKAGLVSTDWTEFENWGTLAHSVAVILTREGNPKGLYSFEDLTIEGVEAVSPRESSQLHIPGRRGSSLGSTQKRKPRHCGCARAKGSHQHLRAGYPSRSHHGFLSISTANGHVQSRDGG